MLMSILIITVLQILRYSKHNMHFYFDREMRQNITFFFSKREIIIIRK